MTRPAILTLLVLALAVSAVGHRTALAVEVVPRIMLRRSDVRIKCLIDPRAENRALIVTAWCDEANVRSSGVELRGDRSAYATWIEWRDLEVCPYAIVAEVIRADGSRIQAQTSIAVPERE